MYSTRSSASGAKNDGQPQCESNLVSLRNSSASQARHLYTPTVLVSVYSPVYGRSVPALRSTWNSAGDSCAFHSASDFSTAYCLVSSVTSSSHRRPGKENPARATDVRLP